MRKAYWLGKLYPLWGCGVAYMNNPEDFSLGTWRNRVVESLTTAISLFAQHTNRLPSFEEYKQLAQNALRITR